MSYIERGETKRGVVRPDYMEPSCTVGCKEIIPSQTSDSVCLFSTNENPICMPSRTYEILREKLITKYKLKNVPSMSEIRDLLGVTTPLTIQDRVRDFLFEEGIDVDDINVVDEFRVKVPDIQYNGLSGLNVTKIYKLLSKYYPFFHYRGPCLLDYAESWKYNYADFESYPLFESNGHRYDVYNLLMLTVRLHTRKPGHWVSVCVVRNAILYFDSLNEQIHPEFQQLLGRIVLELRTVYDRVLTWRNNRQVQYSGKYCGVFQIHFVTTILELHSKGELFKCYGNNVSVLNESALDYYLQSGLTQDIVENTISTYFYVNE